MNTPRLLLAALSLTAAATFELSQETVQQAVRLGLTALPNSPLAAAEVTPDPNEPSVSVRLDGFLWLTVQPMKTTGQVQLSTKGNALLRTHTFVTRFSLPSKADQSLLNREVQTRLALFSAFIGDCVAFAQSSKDAATLAKLVAEKIAPNAPKTQFWGPTGTPKASFVSAAVDGVTPLLWVRAEVSALSIHFRVRYGPLRVDETLVPGPGDPFQGLLSRLSQTLTRAGLVQSEPSSPMIAALGQGVTGCPALEEQESTPGAPTGALPLKPYQIFRFNRPAPPVVEPSADDLEGFRRVLLQNAPFRRLDDFPDCKMQDGAILAVPLRVSAFPYLFLAFNKQDEYLNEQLLRTGPDLNRRVSAFTTEVQQNTGQIFAVSKDGQDEPAEQLQPDQFVQLVRDSAVGLKCDLPGVGETPTPGRVGQCTGRGRVVLTMNVLKRGPNVEFEVCMNPGRPHEAAQAATYGLVQKPAALALLRAKIQAFASGVK